MRYYTDIIIIAYLILVNFIGLEYRTRIEKIILIRMQKLYSNLVLTALTYFR